MRRSLGIVAGPPASVLVVPPAWAGSLGDEAMLQGYISRLRALGVRRIGLLTLDRSKPFRCEAAVDEVLEAGFFFFRPLSDSVPRMLELLPRFELTAIVGADIMDGGYGDDLPIKRIELARLAWLAGCGLVVLGFSFNSHPSPATVRALRTLPPQVEFFLRDPLSLDRFEHWTGRRGVLVADLAFLLEPDTSSAAVASCREWIAGERRAGRTVVGVNLNPLACGGTTVDVFPTIVAWWRDLLVAVDDRRPLSLLLLAHDERPVYGHSDASLLEDLRTSLPAELARHARAGPWPMTAEEAKAIAGEVDAVATSRMHLAIAALGMGTPAVAIDYQDKAAGLFHLFRQDGLVIPSGRFPEPADAARRLGKVLARLPTLRRRLRRRLPLVRDLSERNTVFTR